MFCLLFYVFCFLLFLFATDDIFGQWFMRLVILIMWIACSNGRISLAGITSKDIQPIAEAIHEVTKNSTL